MHRHAVSILVTAVALLTVLGMIMLFSTSAFAQESRGDMYYFVKRQGMWLLVAACGAIFAACVDYRTWSKFTWILFAGAIVLLLLCFVPPIGMRINGSSRWIHFGPMTFQPSELAKVAAIIFLAWWFDRHEARSRTFLHGFFLPLALVGLLIVPVVLEVDLGTSALIGGTAIAILFIAGTALRWLLPMCAIGLAGVYVAATHIDERMGRLLAFMDPEKYKLGEGLQQWQALIAFGSGGTFGLGLGEGRQKLLYLPYAHTDFIFPMIGEELGLWATLATVACYLVICVFGIVIAMNARDRFGMLLGVGCVVMISLQAAVNIGVTTSLLPNKGMPLPFISFGGSNLAICFLMIGILVNIQRHGNPFIETVSPALKRVRNYCRL